MWSFTKAEYNLKVKYINTEKKKNVKQCILIFCFVFITELYSLGSQVLENRIQNFLLVYFLFDKRPDSVHSSAWLKTIIKYDFISFINF